MKFYWGYSKNLVGQGEEPALLQVAVFQILFYFYFMYNKSVLAYRYRHRLRLKFFTLSLYGNKFYWSQWCLQFRSEVPSILANHIRYLVCCQGLKKFKYKILINTLEIEVRFWDPQNTFLMQTEHRFDCVLWWARTSQWTRVWLRAR